MIANQDAAELEKFRSNSGIEFTFLVDDGATVIERYGVANEARSSLPHPATFVLDEGGSISFRSVNPDYKQRPDVKELLLAIANR